MTVQIPDALKRTVDQAGTATDEARLRAVEAVLRWRGGHKELAVPAVAAAILGALAAVKPIAADDCEYVEIGFAEFGGCTRFYGHDGGHYTTEYADSRRPGGSHPWDF